MKKIAQITDIHLEEQFPFDKTVKTKENLEIILNDVTNKNIEKVIFTGDFGTIESNEWFFEVIDNYKFDYDIIIGNYDSFSEIIKFYDPGLPKEQEELFYSKEDDDWKYLFLDSSSSEISQSQLLWLKEELITEKKIILFIHHPILETGTTPQREYPLIGNDSINKEFQKIENEVYIFCGHLHMNDEKVEGNVKQFVTPATSFQAKKYSTTSGMDNIDFGYRIIDIGKGEIRSEVIMFTPY